MSKFMFKLHLKFYSVFTLFFLPSIGNEVINPIIGSEIIGAIFAIRINFKLSFDNYGKSLDIEEDVNEWKLIKFNVSYFAILFSMLYKESKIHNKT